jgi:hypothetical protein
MDVLVVFLFTAARQQYGRAGCTVFLSTPAVWRHRVYPFFHRRQYGRAGCISSTTSSVGVHSATSSTSRVYVFINARMPNYLAFDQSM